MVFTILPHLDALMHVPLTATLVIAALTLDIGIGLLLSYALISKFMAKNESAAAKGASALARLVKIQVPMGLAAMLVGALILVGI